MTTVGAARARRDVGEWGTQRIAPGEAQDVFLPVSERASSKDVHIPIHVRRAEREGPVVFVTAALHGDEINGTGAIRQLIADPEFRPLMGSVILVPVLNVLGFERHSRYLPDRRDLNRSFPGSAGGSMASRMARSIFDELVSRADFGFDIHTAALRRTNYPSIRADMSDPAVRRLAESAGCEIVIDGMGPRGAFRREACLAGCPTVVLEAGEVWKVEPGIVESATRGVRNVLRALGMLPGEPERPGYQVLIETSKWIRADLGGFLQFHIQPGDIVEAGQPLATNTTLLGRERSTLRAPFDAVVIGMTTLPSVTPGAPVCNLGRLPAGHEPAELRRLRSTRRSLEGQLVRDLGSSVLVTEPPEGPPDEPPRR